MKKLLTLIAILFIHVLTLAQDVSSGNITTKEEGEYNKKGNKIGEWKILRKGKLSGIETYVDGEKTEGKSFYENGQLMYIEKFKNGNLTGERKAYYRDGRILKIENYNNGKNDGEWRRYHFNGQLWFVRQYDKGKEIGVWKFYHENGQIKEIGRARNGEQIGKWKYYEEQGNLIKTKKY